MLGLRLPLPLEGRLVLLEGHLARGVLRPGAVAPVVPVVDLEIAVWDAQCGLVSSVKVLPRTRGSGVLVRSIPLGRVAARSVRDILLRAKARDRGRRRRGGGRRRACGGCCGRDDARFHRRALARELHRDL